MLVWNCHGLCDLDARLVSSAPDGNASCMPPFTDDRHLRPNPACVIPLVQVYGMHQRTEAQIDAGAPRSRRAPRRWEFDRLAVRVHADERLARVGVGTSRGRRGIEKPRTWQLGKSSLASSVARRRNQASKNQSPSPVSAEAWTGTGTGSLKSLEPLRRLLAACLAAPGSLGEATG